MFAASQPAVALSTHAAAAGRRRGGGRGMSFPLRLYIGEPEIVSLSGEASSWTEFRIGDESSDHVTYEQSVAPLTQILTTEWAAPLYGEGSCLVVHHEVLGMGITGAVYKAYLCTPSTSTVDPLAPRPLRPFGGGGRGRAGGRVIFRPPPQAGDAAEEMRRKIAMMLEKRHHYMAIKVRELTAPEEFAAFCSEVRYSRKAAASGAGPAHVEAFVIVDGQNRAFGLLLMERIAMNMSRLLMHMWRHERMPPDIPPEISFEALMWEYSQQVPLLLQALHSHGVAHCDLHTSNIAFSFVPPGAGPRSPGDAHLRPRGSNRSSRAEAATRMFESPATDAVPAARERFLASASGEAAALIPRVRFYLIDYGRAMDAMQPWTVNPEVTLTFPMHVTGREGDLVMISFLHFGIRSDLPLLVEEPLMRLCLEQPENERGFGYLRQNFWRPEKRGMRRPHEELCKLLQERRAETLLLPAAPCAPLTAAALLRPLPGRYAAEATAAAAAAAAAAGAAGAEASESTASEEDAEVVVEADGATDAWVRAEPQKRRRRQRGDRGKRHVPRRTGTVSPRAHQCKEDAKTLGRRCRGIRVHGHTVCSFHLRLRQQSQPKPRPEPEPVHVLVQAPRQRGVEEKKEPRVRRTTTRSATASKARERERRRSRD